MTTACWACSRSSRELAFSRPKKVIALLKDETKQQFDAVFSEHARRVEQRRQAKVAQETQEKQFIREFRERCAFSIRPALERIGQFLLSKGLKTRILETREQVGSDGKLESREEIALLLLTGDEPSRHGRTHDFAHVALQPDKHKGVVGIHESTIGPGIGGGQSGAAGTAKLDELTEEFLAQRVLAIVRRVLK